MERQLTGQCLCGAVKFLLRAMPSQIYQCHCSQCRKITGSSANASCLIAEEDFEWMQGESNISSYTHESGYRSDFCKTCGSLVPNRFKGASLYWVPVGALEDTGEMEVAAHLCVSSKAGWEKKLEAGLQYSDVPELTELMQVIGITPRG